MKKQNNQEVKFIPGTNIPFVDAPGCRDITNDENFDPDTYVYPQTDDEFVREVLDEVETETEL